jgi:hypothetical protein
LAIHSAHEELAFISGSEPGIEGVSAYAAPARREDLSGLPPTWVTVGTADLFHDEVVHYANRLQSAGVSTRLEIVPGAFHGFEIASAFTPLHDSSPQPATLQYVDSSRRNRHKRGNNEAIYRPPPVSGQAGAAVAADGDHASLPPPEVAVVVASGPACETVARDSRGRAKLVGELNFKG